MSDADERLLAEQKAYYRARAGEYDEWFFRQGRYDRGAEHRARWFGEIALVESSLRAAALRGQVLELACGTGLWTRHLAGAGRVIAVDSSIETLGINRRRVGSDRVFYLAADVFTLPTTHTFDAVFFAFWLSHVPDAYFGAFWDMVAERLRPGGRVFFVDSLLETTTSAVDHPAPDASGIAHRRLNDGREFDVVKMFYEPSSLEARLHRLGWAGRVQTSGAFFLFGLLTRPGLR